jgi:F-type H+-transporting ATPase subunit b
LGEIISEFVQESLGFIIEVFGGNSAQALQQVGIQIISTILLFLVVRFFFWNKVTDYLEARKTIMTNEYAEAKKANEDAIQTREEATQELTKIRQEAKSLIDQAKERGEDERKELIEQAKKDAEKLIDNAKQDIVSEMEKARQSINDEIVTVATMMAEKIIEKELDEKSYKTLLDRVTDEVADS